MLSYDERDRLTHEIARVLNADANLASGAADGNLHALAEVVMRACRAAAKQVATDNARDVGAKLAAHGVTPETLVAICQAPMRPTLAHGTGESDDS